MKHHSKPALPRRGAAVAALGLLLLLTGSFPAAGSTNSAELSAPAVVRGASWYLRNTADTGIADTSFVYGNPSDQKLMGDWDGDGTKTPAVYRDGTFYLRNSNDSGIADFTVEFYPPGPVAASPVVVIYPEVALAGDWNGDGVDGIGVFDNGTWDLFDPGETEADDEEFFFRYGNASDYPIAGDWDGDGSDTPGVVRGARWFLRNQNTTGVADTSFVYGDPGDIPVPADFDGDGTDGPTVVRGRKWYVRNSVSTGVADRSFFYGDPGDVPLDWHSTQQQCEQALGDAGLTAPANANYIVGTSGDDDFSSQLTPGNDVICGFGGHDVIATLGAAGNDIFLGGDGDDLVSILDENGTFKGEAGCDHVTLVAGTFDPGDQSTCPA